MIHVPRPGGIAVITASEPGARLAPVPSASLPDLPHGELVICRTVPD